jgi:hypothetical protein
MAWSAASGRDRQMGAWAAAGCRLCAEVAIMVLVGAVLGR